MLAVYEAAVPNNRKTQNSPSSIKTYSFGYLWTLGDISWRQKSSENLSSICLHVERYLCKLQQPDSRVFNCLERLEMSEIITM